MELKKAPCFGRSTGPSLLLADNALEYCSAPIVFPAKAGTHWFTVVSRPNHLCKRTLSRSGFLLPQERRGIPSSFWRRPESRLPASAKHACLRHSWIPAFAGKTGDLSSFRRKPEPTRLPWFAARATLAKERHRAVDSCGSRNDGRVRAIPQRIALYSHRLART